MNNISYSIEEYGIEFNFTYGPGVWMTAILQLPNTPDSQHSIDSENYDNENEKHQEIYEVLRDYYYADFKDIECAKASIIAQERIIHVEQFDSYYVAFSANSAHVLQEGRLSSYCNVFYFDKYQERYDGQFDEPEIIEKAKKAWFNSLKNELETKLIEENKSWEANGFPTSGNYIDDPIGMAENCPDESVTKFMGDNFESDWRDSEIANDFYQTVACDCRGDAEIDAKERYQNSLSIEIDE